MEACLEKDQTDSRQRQTGKHYTGQRAFAGAVRGRNLPTGSSCRCHMPAELELLPEKTVSAPRAIQDQLTTFFR